MDEGEAAMEAAVNIRKKTLGEIHPDTSLSKACLSSFYREKGKKKEAENILKECLNQLNKFYEAKGKISSSNGPVKATILNNLAYLYKTTERADKAIPLYLQG